MKSSMGLAAAVLIGTFVWLVASPLAGTPAYGIEDMPRRLLAIKGLHVRGWFNAAPPTATQPSEAHKLPVEFYVERPGRYWLTNYGAKREGPPRRVFSDGLRYMEIEPDAKTCTTGKEVPLAAELKVEEMLQILFAEQFLGGLNAGYKKTGTERIKGIMADVYERNRSLGGIGGARIVLHLNPATGLPVQATGYQRMKDQPERTWFCLTDIEPNVPLPIDLLDFSPPAGYEVIEQDREPEEIGTTGGVSISNTRGMTRFAFNIDDRAILLCWAMYDSSKPAAAQEDLEGPVGRRLKLTPLSRMPGRTYGHYFLRADLAGEFHWRWSLIVPTSGGSTLDGDEPRLEFKVKLGGTGTILIAPYRFPRERLADLVARTQRLTLPADASPGAVLTLEQIEAKIAELTAQAP